MVHPAAAGDCGEDGGVRIERIGDATLYLGNCLEVLPTLPVNSVDSIVTDPPYGIGFMGRGWDHGVPGVEFWAEALRVAKPGAHLLAFGGTRMHHRLMVAIEDAGWEIRDTVMWVYGSGFPKSLDVSKAIDKAAGVEFLALPASGVGSMGPDGPGGYNVTKNQLRRIGEQTEAAQQWAGWGTALKPAWEPIIVARKPLTGTVAANVLEYGTGGINVDGCRVECSDKAIFPAGVVSDTESKFGNGAGLYADRPRPADNNPQGRWPANVIHDGSEEVLAGFPVTGPSKRGNKGLDTSIQGGQFAAGKHVEFVDKIAGHDDNGGSAARFFYCAKASKADRNEGCESLPQRTAGEATGGRQEGSDGLNSPRAGAGRTNGAKNHHPTVKPTALMRYLCRLVTPPGGVVLDPFMGSGSTGKAAVVEGFRFIGVDREVEYLEIARARIEQAYSQARLLAGEAPKPVQGAML